MAERCKRSPFNDGELQKTLDRAGDKGSAVFIITLQNFAKERERSVRRFVLDGFDVSAADFAKSIDDRLAKLRKTFVPRRWRRR